MVPSTLLMDETVEPFFPEGLCGFTATSKQSSTQNDGLADLAYGRDFARVGSDSEGIQMDEGRNGGGRNGGSCFTHILVHRSILIVINHLQLLLVVFPGLTFLEIVLEFVEEVIVIILSPKVGEPGT